MHGRLSPLFFVAALGSLFCLTLACAQEGKGSVAGTVKDSANAVLTGALVELQTLGRKVVSDDQGQFRITDVPAGQYTVVATYVGFAPFSAPATVTAGQTANVDATLNVASRNDDVLVTAERLQGEAEAINVERTSDNIVQVLPAKVINSLPNTNIADAVGRVPSVTLERDEGEGKYVQIRGTDPRLSNLTINGVNVPSPEGGVRNVKMDTIPANLFERIEVNKTLAANQDGDGIGGSVNLVTPIAPPKLTYSLEGLGGYTHIQGGRGLDSLNGTIGRRFGAANKLGIMIGGGYDWNGRGIDDLEPSQGTVSLNGKNYAAATSEDLRTYEYYRTRFGYSVGLDYNLSPNSSLYLKGLYADFHDYGETWVYSPNTGSLVGVNGSQLNFDNTGFMQYRHYVRRPDQGVSSLSTGARHDLKSTLVTYEFAASRGHNRGGQDFATTWFAGPTGLNLNLDQSDPFIPKITAPAGVNIFDPTQYFVGTNSASAHNDPVIFPYYNSAQLNLQGAASVARRYTAGGHYGTFEVGFKIRNAHKTQNENDQEYNSTVDISQCPAKCISLAQALGTYSNPTYYNNALKTGPLSSYDAISQLVASNLATGFALDTPGSIAKSQAATYDLTERVYAGYLMNAINIRKWRLVTGVRFEGTHADYNANNVVKNPNSSQPPTVTPLLGGADYLNVLGSAQLQYQIEKNTNVRASFGMGVSRPNYQDQVPSVTVDPNASPKSVQVGNPNLVATKANNYDLLLEHFFQPLGILQAGVFYKDLTDPIYQTTSIIQPGNAIGPTGFQLQEAINGPTAHITGFEMAWEQRFSFLPGLLKGFGVAANYSWTTSRVAFPANFSGGRIDHPSLDRQAPNTWNLGATYDKGRLSMRFGVSHNDANIYAYNYTHVDAATDNDPILGLKGPTGDVYLYAHTQYDIQGSYRMYRGLQLIVYGLNLSNEVFGFYQGSPIYPIQREFYHPTVAAGFRWSSGAEQ